MGTRLPRTAPATLLIPLTATLGQPTWVTTTITVVTLLMLLIDALVTQTIRLHAAQRLPATDAARVLDSHHHH